MVLEVGRVRRSGRPRGADGVAVPALRLVPEPVADLDGARRAIEHWGALLVLPARGMPVPSLWELQQGRPGPLVSMGWDEIGPVMGWRAALLQSGDALASRWLGGRQALLHPSLVSLFATRAPRLDPGDEDALRLLVALSGGRRLSPAALARAAGLGAKSARARFDEALERLETAFLVAAAPLDEPGSDAWGSEGLAAVEALAPGIAAPALSESLLLARQAGWLGVGENTVRDAFGWSSAVQPAGATG